MAAKSASQSPALITLKPSQASSAIRHMIKVNLRNAKLRKKRRGLFLWGPPGIAKSSIVEQIADELNFKLIDIRLTQMEPTDLRGIPVPVHGDGETLVHWAVPALLPRRDPNSRKTTLSKHETERRNSEDTTYAGAIILLDELPNAVPSVQAGSYQLVLDGRLGEYVVPDNAIVMAAGNRDTDKGSTFKMPTPLLNRFTHIEITSDFDDWQVHALNASFHKDVVGYLTAFKHQLFQFNPSSASRGFQTPRSWEAVSDILHVEDDLPEIVKLGLIGGTVGDATAIEFIEYQKNAATLPNPGEILDGKIKELKNKEVSLAYALTTAMCYELRDRYNSWTEDKDSVDFVSSIDNFLGYMLDNFQPEMVIMGAKTALTTFKIKFPTKNMTRWSDFSSRYKDMIIRS